MTVRHYTDLIAWQKAMDLVELVYAATESFPRREMFGLTNQLRRAAVSIPSNIAEGQGRSTTRDFLHFLAVAKGSLQEVETQALIAFRLCVSWTRTASEACWRQRAKSRGSSTDWLVPSNRSHDPMLLSVTTDH